MKIKFWGVRGSIPTPLTSREIEEKIRKALTLARPGDLSSAEAVDAFIRNLPFSVKGTYGGNTTTIQVVPDSSDMIILDCGSGLHDLGHELLKSEFGRGQGMANILLTHTHWDHIQGIPFFTPMYYKGNRFHFYSPLSDMKERLDYQQAGTHFPVTLDYMAASKEFFQLEPEEDLYLNDVRIYNKRMPHPGGSFGYRIEEKGRVFVYTSDCEFSINSIDNIGDYEPFFTGADVAVFDTQYTFEESVNKLDYGHSSGSIAIDIARIFGIKRLVMFHHEPNYDDEMLDSVLANAKSYLHMHLQKMVGKMELDIAYEGMEIDL